MPYCPRCKTEYRRGITRCPDCGEALVEKLPEPDEARYARVAPLTRVADPSEADIVVAVLGEHGISAFARRHGPITGELGRVTDGMTEDYAIVYVQQERLEEARNLLDDLRSGTIEWPEGSEPEEGEVA